jgi:hypothetical protein
MGVAQALDELRERQHSEGVVCRVCGSMILRFFSLMSRGKSVAAAFAS